MQSNTLIPDPRIYANAYPESNILINQAIKILNNLEPQLNKFANLNNGTAIDKHILINTLDKLLLAENDALINVALNLSPSYAVANLIWQSLNIVIQNTVNENHKQIATIFAIPVVLVIGSKTKSVIDGTIDTGNLNEFFIKNNLISDGWDFFISGKLIDATAITKIKPSQLYYWARNIKSANLWLPYDLPASNIEVINEGIFLRFLVGVAIDNNNYGDNGSDANKNVNGINQENFLKQSISLMQLINQQLKQEAVTLFTIPFIPVNLSDAFRVGDSYRKEIAIQVALSNAIKQIRSHGLVPMVKIISENNAIKLVTYSSDFSSPHSNDIIETSLWQLHHLDDFDLIINKITHLLDDMQVQWNYATTE